MSQREHGPTLMMGVAPCEQFSWVSAGIRVAVASAGWNRGDREPMHGLCAMTLALTALSFHPGAKCQVPSRPSPNVHFFENLFPRPAPSLLCHMILKDRKQQRCRFTPGSQMTSGSSQAGAPWPSAQEDQLVGRNALASTALTLRKHKHCPTVNTLPTLKNLVRAGVEA